MQCENNEIINYRKFLAPEIVYGSGSIELAGRPALNFGAKKMPFNSGFDNLNLQFIR